MLFQRIHGIFIHTWGITIANTNVLLSSKYVYLNVKARFSSHSTRRRKEWKLYKPYKKIGHTCEGEAQTALSAL